MLMKNNFEIYLTSSLQTCVFRPQVIREPFYFFSSLFGFFFSRQVLRIKYNNIQQCFSQITELQKSVQTRAQQKENRGLQTTFSKVRSIFVQSKSFLEQQWYGRTESCSQTGGSRIRTLYLNFSWRAVRLGYSLLETRSTLIKTCRKIFLNDIFY